MSERYAATSKPQRPYIEDFHGAKHPAQALLADLASHRRNSLPDRFGCLKDQLQISSSCVWSMSQLRTTTEQDQGIYKYYGLIDTAKCCCDQ